MTMFWVAAGVCVLLGVAFLIVPLARRAATNVSAPARADFDLTVYKDQLGEIDRDMERGVLNEDQALAARTEIERRMLAAAEPSDTGLEIAETSHPRSTMALMVSILMIVPLGALSLYLYLGQPTLPDQPLASRAPSQAGDHGGIDEADRERAREMLAQLEQQLKENPKDVKGWLVLAEIYDKAGRYNDAAGVYETIAGLTERHPQALAAWAEMLIVADDTIVSTKASKLLAEVKQKDPSDPRSYFYLALGHQQKGDLKAAMDEYVALLKVTPEDAEWVPQIQQQLGSLSSEMGVEMPKVTMMPSASSPADVAGPTPEQVREAQEMSMEDQQAMIKAMVDSLAQRLKDAPDDLAGWKRLAQAYSVLGDQAGLAEAQANIDRLSGL
ncbi:MAG: c-type cytochrome biogenesis protein CcmI [Magnetovibrio sp.]|nr:c-type cytochrome biogenesis protein CcmI [Magnetovibrio sp.]